MPRFKLPIIGGPELVEIAACAGKPFDEFRYLIFTAQVDERFSPRSRTLTDEYHVHVSHISDAGGADVRLRGTVHTISGNRPWEAVYNTYTRSGEMIIAE